MSSNPRSAAITPFEMKMIQSVLDDAGYDADVVSHDQPIFNAAAQLLVKLFLAGETSPYALGAQLERNFGKSPKRRVPYKSLLPRYAIQGLPVSRSKLDKAGTPKRSRSKAADLQSWENEGGA